MTTFNKKHVKDTFMTYKGLTLFLYMVFCFLTVDAHSYIVVRVVGTVEKMTSNGWEPVRKGEYMQSSDFVELGKNSMLVIIDKEHQKNISLTKSGRKSLDGWVKDSSCSIMSVSKSFIEYVLNPRPSIVSDPAALTMDSQDYGADDGDRENNPEGFIQRIMHDYGKFRDKCFQEYIGFVRQAWNPYDALPAVPLPHREDLRPVEYRPEDDNGDPEDALPIRYDSVLVVEDAYEQPVPYIYVPEAPSARQDECLFTFYGTRLNVRMDRTLKLVVRSTKEDDVADALKVLGNESFNNTLRDCLVIRRDMRLSDWAYLLLLRQMAGEAYGWGTNEAILLTAYLYMQSGYKMRLAADYSRLYLLVQSEHSIYGKKYYELEGERYYAFEDLPLSLKICEVAFPEEKALSLIIEKEQLFDYERTETRTVSSARYPEMSVSFDCNRNLLDFYNTYPTSEIGSNHVSRWAMYANVPLLSTIKEQIYPTMEKAIENCDELEAVNKLLNWVQTGFKYKLDNEVWGADRAFFAEETLFYPYCDCEDRSILFTRLVRDLLGLKCILVYYPNHLAAAVHFTHPISGDYIEYEGQRYTIADPTYIPAPVGRTMSRMNNSTATVILLKD